MDRDGLEPKCLNVRERPLGGPFSVQWHRCFALRRIVAARPAPVGTSIARYEMSSAKPSLSPDDLAFCDADREGRRFGLRKSLIARSSLLITNDTGPRHFAIAFDVPVVTIFGPTHPEWTETNYRYERKIMIPVECGPCQKPVCPLDHRCMTGIPPADVVQLARQLLASRKK